PNPLNIKDHVGIQNIPTILDDAGSETRPPLLKGLVNITLGCSTLQRLQEVEDLQGDGLLYYDRGKWNHEYDSSFSSNEIYNSVDLERGQGNVGRLLEREFIVSVYNLWQRNGMNCDQVRLAKQLTLIRLTVDSFDDLFDYLSQFEKLVNASREKKLEKSHDPLALVAHTGSSSRNTSSYYVTHPSSVVDYDEEYEQDDVHNHSEDPLASAMLLLAKAITQNFSNPTNNRLRASSNTRNQAVVQGDRVNIQSRNSSNVGRNNRRAYVQGEVVEGMNATNETANDEAGVILTDEQNDFLFADALIMEEIKELKTLARNAYDEAAKQQRFAQKVQQQNMTLTSQIEMYKERNRVLENITKDNNYLKEFLEADEREKRVQKQAESQLYRDRDIIRDLEKQRDKLSQEVKHFKQKNEELQQSHLILKRKMSENEDKYHDTILDLEEKLKKNVDLFLKIGNSLQAMFMLGPKPLSVYDQQLKHGLGYPNPYTLRQAILECPKLYVASRTGNIEIPLNVRDSEETLEEAFKSQQKMNAKMNDPIAVANKQNC
ncbi:hypothetical protein Tco_0560659, partial [Tanacetum coccineum]